MTTLIKSLKIDYFRAFQNVRVDGFGKVNLITGRNNSGKSSLLEAVRILSSGGSIRTIFDILNYREELWAFGETEKPYFPTDINPFCNLINGFPDISSCRRGFSISATGTLPASISSISVGISWFTRKIEIDSERQTISYEPVSGDIFNDIERFPALYLDISGKKRVIPLDRLQRRYPMRGEVDTLPVSCVYLDPFSSRSTSQMGALWDSISLTDTEKEIVKALTVISPDIQAISMIGSDERGSRSRTAIARSIHFPSPLPLRSFGDGVNRLFGIILSLCNARNGVLLVDEIENGLHYSVQTEIWRSIFALAKDLNVQVFATSHSWDCVRAFQEAASESPEEGVLIRLSRKGEEIIPTIFTEQELKIVTRDQIEVR